MRAGQVSIEYLLVMGFSLLMLIPLLIFFFTQSDDLRSETRQAQATLLGRELADSAERVYLSGPPSFEHVRARVPEGVLEFRVTNSSIVITMQGISAYDLVFPSDVPLQEATLNARPGIASYRVEAFVSGTMITET